MRSERMQGTPDKDRSFHSQAQVGYFFCKSVQCRLVPAEVLQVRHRRVTARAQMKGTRAEVGGVGLREKNCACQFSDGFSM